MQTRRERHEGRLKSLKGIRATWDPTWKDICEQLVPYRAIFDRSQRGRGDKLESKILNNTPVRALHTLAAGMMAGITSPARQWFGLTTVDPELAKQKRVKEFLDLAEERINAMFAESNWYTALANGTYLDLGSIGTSAMFHEEDGRGGLRYAPLPIGEYYLDQDAAGRVDTCFRELDLSVRQIVEKFGYRSCSQGIRNSWDKSNYDQLIGVRHAIQPHDGAEYGRPARGMRYASCWWEEADGSKDAFLKESGYFGFPILAPRWFVRPGDVYGRGPGWFARGDCRVLQLHEKRLLTMIDKTTDPPMKLSEGIGRASLLPGDKTYMPDGATPIFEPAMEILPGSLDVMEKHVMRTEYRIEQVFYVDLWQTFLQDERAQRQTATEVEAKREERMLMLGPVLENMNGGLLEPAVERNFDIAVRTDRLPPPPPELVGAELKVKFVSIMHEAQQVPKLAGVRTLIAEAAELANLRSDVLDKLNPDVLLDEIVSITGVRSDAVLSKDEVEAVRKQKAKDAQARQTGEAMLSASQGVKNLGSVDPQKLSEVAGTLAPVAAGQAGALQQAAA